MDIPTAHPEHHAGGVAWCPDINTDVLLITLKKTDTDYSPTTMYRDFAISPELSTGNPNRQRTPLLRPASAINHRRQGTNILLFVRETKTNQLGAAPYVFLGPADYVKHEGSRPMAVTWLLPAHADGDLHGVAAAVA